jgi:predicted nucleic acid-binding Zn ribbon protein
MHESLHAWQTPGSLAGDAHLWVPLPGRPRVRGYPRHRRPAPTVCEVCGAAPVNRVFYPISTSFTGTGFYSTDYGQGEQKPETTAPADDSAKSSDKGAKKTDEKTTNTPEPD